MSNPTGQSSDPGVVNMTANQRFQVEMKKLELQIAQLHAAHGRALPTGSPQVNTKLADLKEDARELFTAVRLDGSTNYDSWKEEIMALALSIEAKDILLDSQLTCPSQDPKEIEMWKVRSTALFKVILGSLKPSIKKSIRRKIKETNRNGAEIWNALENEYNSFKLDTRDTICNQISSINLNAFNDDITRYITRFRKLVEMLKELGPDSELPQFFIVNRFLAGLNEYESAFIQTEKDKIRDVNSKERLAHLDLDVLMDQLTTRARTEKNPSVKMTTENEKKTFAAQKNETKDQISDSGFVRRGELRDRSKENNPKIPCSYCGVGYHSLSVCWYKNPELKDTEWTKRNRVIIEKLKKRDDPHSEPLDLMIKSENDQPEGLNATTGKPPNPNRHSNSQATDPLRNIFAELRK